MAPTNGRALPPSTGGYGAALTRHCAYRLLLAIRFSIASCERSFSKLKLIKTSIRLSMLQERLTSLALNCIAREFLSADVKNEVVKIFSDRRAHMGKRNRKM